jgi:hypothetical protein
MTILEGFKKSKKSKFKFREIWELLGSLYQARYKTLFWNHDHLPEIRKRQSSTVKMWMNEGFLILHSSRDANNYPKQNYSPYCFFLAYKSLAYYAFGRFLDYPVHHYVYTLKKANDNSKDSSMFVLNLIEGKMNGKGNTINSRVSSKRMSWRE